MTKILTKTDFAPKDSLSDFPNKFHQGNLFFLAGGDGYNPWPFEKKVVYDLQAGIWKVEDGVLTSRETRFQYLIKGDSRDHQGHGTPLWWASHTIPISLGIRKWGWSYGNSMGPKGSHYCGSLKIPLIWAPTLSPIIMEVENSFL